MVEIFLSGGAMRGGPAHQYVQDGRFLGERETAPEYKFFEIRNRFPALCPVGNDGVQIAGELFDVQLDTLREKFLPMESPELELSIIKLSDGTSCLAMVLRTTDRDRGKYPDISKWGCWRAYRGLKMPTSNEDLTELVGTKHE